MAKIFVDVPVDGNAYTSNNVTGHGSVEIQVGGVAMAKAQNCLPIEAWWGTT